MSPSWIRKFSGRSKGHSATPSTESGGSGGKGKGSWPSDGKKGGKDPLATASALTTQAEPVGPDHYVLFTERVRVEPYQPDGRPYAGRIVLRTLSGTDGTRFTPSQLGIKFSLDNQVIVDPARLHGGEANPHFVFPSAACPTIEGQSMIFGTLDLPDGRRRHLAQRSGRRTDWAMIGKPDKEEGDIITRYTDLGPGFTEVSVHRGTFDCFREGKFIIPGPSGMDEEFEPAAWYNTHEKPLQQASYSSQIVDSDPDKKPWPKHELLSDKCPENLDPKTLLTYFDSEKTRAYISGHPRVFGLHGYATPCHHASQPEYMGSTGDRHKNLSCGEKGCNTIELHYALKLSHAEFDQAARKAYDLTGGWQNDPESQNDRSAAFVKEPNAREGEWRTEQVTLPGFDPYSWEGRLIRPIKVTGTSDSSQAFSLIGKKIENVWSSWARDTCGGSPVVRFAQDGQMLDDGSTLLCAYTGSLANQPDRKQDDGALRLEKGEVISEVEAGGHRSYWLRQGNWLVSATSERGSSGLSYRSETGGPSHWSRGKGKAEGMQKDGETVLALSSDPSVRSFHIKNFDDKIKMLHGYQESGTEKWTMRYFVLKGSGLDGPSKSQKSKLTVSGSKENDEDPPPYSP